MRCWNKCADYLDIQLNIVWFKKDLRDTDHQPLASALKNGATVGLYILEADWLSSPEYDSSHLAFCRQSLSDLQEKLRFRGIPLVVRFGDAVEIFSDLNRVHSIAKVFSHQETGLDWSYQRDIRIKSWFKLRGIEWIEFNQVGVIRGLKNRDRWAIERKKIIERQIVEVGGQGDIKCPWQLSVPEIFKSPIQTKPFAQVGGVREARKTLQSFVELRHKNYVRSLSSPNRAFDGCSRLSPYLAWGNLSLTEVYNVTKQNSSSPPQFESRLWWRCHFMQKLESEPEIEFHNFNRRFDGLRETEFDQNKFESWCRGETGFPMIDACMRALHAHGWINFRMRAMLMSFAAYQLWLHWKKPAEYLARQFIDFEPGIHYSQAQMQSGVTGINTIRIYSPKKQLIDQDPKGEFIKKYLPELAAVPLSDLAEPHKMPPLLQMDTGFIPGSTYPLPIVDPDKSYDLAKSRIFLWKTREDVKAQSRKVYKRHGSRKR